MQSAGERTVGDFGEQWTAYGHNDGFYASVELLEDMLGPLVSREEIEGARIADIGSGTGRIVRMLLDAGAAHVVAIEPSAGVERLRANTRDVADRVEVIQATGEAIPQGRDFDLVLSIGVIQFIPDPQPVLRAARDALRPGGRIAIWVYAKEGTALYRVLLGALRRVTTSAPHGLLSALCAVLTVLVDGYTWLCRGLPLPLRDYLVNTLARVDWKTRKLTIYDQLNPSYVVFHSRDEAAALLTDAGFEDVELYHRRGYSWTVTGRRPLSPDDSPDDSPADSPRPS